MSASMTCVWCILRAPTWLIRKFDSRLAECDQRLGKPARGGTEYLGHESRTKQRRAHDARTQSFGMRAQEQVLSGHCHALHGHRVLCRLSCRIRIAVHVFRGQEHEDQYRRFEESTSRARHIGLHGRCVISIGQTIRPKSIAHGFRNRILLRGLTDDQEPPRLAVVCRRRPCPCCGLQATRRLRWRLKKSRSR